MRVSPMEKTSEPLMAVPQPLRSRNDFWRKGFFWKNLREMQELVQPESPKTGKRRLLNMMKNIARHFGRASGSLAGREDDATLLTLLTTGLLLLVPTLAFPTATSEFSFPGERDAGIAAARR